MPSWRSALLGLTLLVAGCPTAEPLDVEGDCAVLTWENYGEGEMRNWCTGCHSSGVVGANRNGAPSGVDFDDLVGVREHRERILARATGDNPTMPLVGGGDAEDRERLRQWLECGAP